MKKGTEARALPMSVLDATVCPHCNVPRKCCALHPFRLTADIEGATHAPVAKRAWSAADLAPRQFAPECRRSILSVTTTQLTDGCNDPHNYDVPQQFAPIKHR